MAYRRDIDGDDIEDSSIVDADISPAAGIDPSKIAGTAWTSTNDGAASGLDADVLDAQQGTFYLARANHTGTQTAATISDFDTQVRTNRVDQMAQPTASVDFNAQKLIDLAPGVAGTDAVNVNQISGLATDGNVVHIAGTETVTGTKTLNSVRNARQDLQAAGSNAISATAGHLVVLSGTTITAATLPAGETGLPYYISNSANNANQEVTLTAAGLDRIFGPGHSSTGVISASIMRGQTVMVEFVAANEWRITPLGAPPTIGASITTMPANPYDGMEVIYQNTAMATDGVSWHFRYRKDSASALKWECIGCEALGAQEDTTRSSSSTTYASLTGALSVTAPLAGDYYVEQSGISYLQANGGASFLSYAVGAVAALDVDSLTVQQTSTGGTTPILVPGHRKKRKNGITASDAIVEKAKVSTGTGNFLYRYLGIMPIRVS